MNVGRGMIALNESADVAIYVVVKNREEQYSIWPKRKKLPAGWDVVNKEGEKDECLRYIDEVWTDMRPLSLRKRMEDSKACRS
jgi:MbtH protein